MGSVSGYGQGVRERLRTPGVLIGTWQAAETCASNPFEQLELTAEIARLSGRSGQAACDVAGWRAVTATRWYIDLDCAGGSRTDLDINLLADGRMLIALRPLGEACNYERAAR